MRWMIGALGWSAAAANAAPLEWSGTLQIEFGSPPIAVFSALGAGIAEGSSPDAFTLPGGVFVVDVDDEVVLPATPQDVTQTLRLSADNEPGAFSNGLLRMPLLGVLSHLGYRTTPLYSFALELLPVHPIGSAATTAISFSIFSGMPTETFTTSATLSGDDYAVTDDQRTAQGGGRLQLVAPFTFRSLLAASELPGRARLTLEFVPEPATLAAGACALGALLALGLRRPTSCTRR